MLLDLLQGFRNFEFLARMSGVKVWSRTYALLCSSTSAGVELLGFQSSLSGHEVELWSFSVRVLVVSSNVRSKISIHSTLDKTYQRWYILGMKPILNASFFRTDSGNEPVREWLKALSATERRIMGEDIKTVQFGWPLGMPLVRHLEGGIWEIRIKLENRIARILFCLEGSTMVILHGFIKKQQATPKQDLDLAKERLKILKRK